MDLRRISAPLTRAQKLDVVSLAEVKAQARVMHDEENDLIESYIATAYDYLSGPEGWTNGYCLLEEEFEVYVETLVDVFELPVRPFMGDTVGFARRDAIIDTYADIDAATYILTNSGDFGMLARLQPSLVSPPAFARDPRRYRIRFKAGHEDPATIPEGLKQSIKLLAAHWYVNREATIADPRVSNVSREVQLGVRSLAGRYRIEPDHS
ncbi:head-tail connector protein [Methylobacterium aquaticum]|uniref:Phage gp6-like head-tail connector protein n=1 Tax=Methylobacterium aquaticum TaxID=270351 RepID=A0A0J6SGG1_9HYPH|nr:phage head-tail connector protein [Methylobacterium aquaticum]KMO34320.1 hypothetical protein VP06_14740 [Methylobacterium aquaticum]